MMANKPSIKLRLKLHSVPEILQLHSETTNDDERVVRPLLPNVRGRRERGCGAIFFDGRGTKVLCDVRRAICDNTRVYVR
ncbi:MAG: hypothetical protein LBS94_03560 [Prevotellaceae bacterium]|nr:hypothetical protein [Prevotellaceae bacterium]